MFRLLLRAVAICLLAVLALCQQASCDELLFRAASKQRIQHVFLRESDQPRSSEGAILCGIDSYNVQNLTSASSWELQANVFCLDQNATSPNCTFIFSFCHPLADFVNSTCENASVCQQDMQGGGSTQNIPFKIGSYSRIHNPFIKSLDIYHPEGFSAQFKHGVKINDSNHNLTAVGVAIFFNCDADVFWLPNADGRSAVPGNYSVIWDSETFTYWIKVNYAGACLPLTPSSGDIVIIIEMLSVGSILVIVFTVSISVYCVGGCIAQAAMGKRGPEVIPHQEFWSTLPSYTKDGFAVSWNAIQCKKTTSPMFAPKSGYDSI